MKIKLILSAIVIISLGVYACKSRSIATGPSTASTDHNSMNSVDWDGTYHGTLPCADCAGIETEITLNRDLTYSIRRKYRGKENTVFETRGKFSWNEEGSVIALNGDSKSYYQVGENKIFLLDENRKQITGKLAQMYVLTKGSSGITGRYWKLIEIGGQPLTGQPKKEPFIQLDGASNRITGTGGCNSFGGTFELKPNNRIGIGNLIATKMACLDMKTEQQLFKVLESVDSYTVQGDTLLLNRARMAPLARFVASNKP